MHSEIIYPCCDVHCTNPSNFSTGGKRDVLVIAEGADLHYTPLPLNLGFITSSPQESSPENHLTTSLPP